MRNALFRTHLYRERLERAVRELERLSPWEAQCLYCMEVYDARHQHPCNERFKA